MNAPIHIVKTSETDWLKKLAVAYKAREDVTLVDDAKFGLNPESDTLYRMGIKAKLSKAEIVGVCTALGIGAVGIAVIVAAFFDPEPTTKILLIGAALLFSGGFTAIRILTRLTPPSIKIIQNNDGSVRWNLEWH